MARRFAENTPLGPPAAHTPPRIGRLTLSTPHVATAAQKPQILRPVVRRRVNVVDVGAWRPAENTTSAVPCDHETADAMPFRRESSSEPRGTGAPTHTY